MHSSRCAFSSLHTQHGYDGACQQAFTRLCRAVCASTRTLAASSPMDWTSAESVAPGDTVAKPGRLAGYNLNDVY
jgi:hypothetical protein